MSPLRRALVWGIAFLLWAALPFFATRHIVDLLVFAGLYTIAGLGVAFLLGQCGIVSLAQSVFYGVGAYCTAWFCVQKGLPSPVGIAAGIALSTGIAALVGWPILRLSGHFLALATLALGIIGQVLFLEWDWLTRGSRPSGSRSTHRCASISWSGRSPCCCWCCTTTCCIRATGLRSGRCAIR